MRFSGKVVLADCNVALAAQIAPMHTLMDEKNLTIGA
jgi:hypothetical protein